MKKLLIMLFIGLFSLSGCSFNSNLESSNNSSLDNSNYNASKTVVDNTANIMNEPKKEEPEEISSFSTKIHDKSANRQNNIKITASKLTGTTINPGEEFSFCTIVGKSTPEKGYEKAKIFDKNGNVKEGYRRRKLPS